MDAPLALPEIPLAFPFTRDRFSHRLVSRDGDVCLVERTNLVTNSIHWEVVVLAHRPADSWPDGRETPPREAYPASEDWGTHGWTFTTLPDAETRYAKVVRDRNQNA